MKFKLLYLFLYCSFALAQVGIGTTNPDPSSSLDISSSSTGLLIPRMSALEKTAIPAPARGLMVYQIDNISGFYYYDGTAWRYLVNSSVNAWSRIGNSGTDPTVDFIGTTDDTPLVFRTNSVANIQINPNNNVGIGTALNTARLYTNIDGSDSTTNYGIRNVHQGVANDTKYGIYNNVSDAGTGGRYGIYNITSQNSAASDNAFGNYNYLTSHGSGNAYGLLNYHFVLGTGRSYGISNTLNLTNTTTDDVYLNYHFLNASYSSNTATLYGAYYDIDYNSGTRYGTFKTMGSSSAYNGDMYGDYNRIYGDGDGLVFGQYNELSGSGFGTKYGVYNQFSNGERDKNGIYNDVQNTNNGIVYGMRNEFSNNVSSTPKYGVYNNLVGNEGTQYGVYNNLVQSSTSTRNVYGFYSYIQDTGLGTHYGGFFNANGAGHYGLYSQNTHAAGYAGYFNGNVSIIGQLNVEDDIVPLTDGSFNLGSLSNRWDTVFAVNGTIQTSDIRLKKEVQALEYGLNEILKLEPISYIWKDERLSPQNASRKIGLSAQNVQELIREVVKEDRDSQVLGVNYGELIPVLIKAIQEQQAQITLLKETVNKLKNDK